ncbi:MAG: hypothetical protein JSS82_13615 [Bacteroidetes bacterium]|nr:hypothetical protein [Bacteroidota bacterium]
MKWAVSTRYKYFALFFCIAGFLFNYYSCYPGFASPDTIDQYHQALAGRYTDWHPPVMAMLWHLLNYIVKGPQIMLLLQMLLLWGACWLLLTQRQSVKWYICVIMFAWAPFVQNFSGYIIKDSQMALSLLLAVVLMLRIGIKKFSEAKWEIMLCAILLVYGSIVRPNAPPAALPLCFLFAWVLFRDSRRFVKVAAGVSFMLFIVLCNSLQYGVVHEDDMQYPTFKIYMYDLTGIYNATGDNVFPSFLYQNPRFDTAYLRTHYIPATFDDIWWNADSVEVIPEGTKEVSVALKAAWLSAIKKHPAAYMANHADGFLYYLRLKRRNINFHYYFPYACAELPGYQKGRDYCGEIPFEAISFQSFMPYMAPWFWFFVNFILLLFIPFVAKGVHRWLYIALCLSGIFYQLPSFFVYQTDTDFRYFYWNCICCSLALIILIGMRRAE